MWKIVVLAPTGQERNTLGKKRKKKGISPVYPEENSKGREKGVNRGSYKVRRVFPPRPERSPVIYRFAKGQRLKTRGESESTTRVGR